MEANLIKMYLYREFSSSVLTNDIASSWHCLVLSTAYATQCILSYNVCVRVFACGQACTCTRMINLNGHIYITHLTIISYNVCVRATLHKCA